MATRDDIAEIAAAIPGMVVSEDGRGVGMIVKGKWKGLVWPWNERKAPKQPKEPHPVYIAVRVANLDAKAMILASNPQVFFTEDHYNGYPAVLVRTDLIDRSDLEDLLIEAWRVRATKAQLAEFESEAGPR